MLYFLSGFQSIICKKDSASLRSLFDPRPPRGGRPAVDFINRCPLHISIHALREEGDRLLHDVLAIPRSISIHALREEGDVSSCSSSGNLSRFLSTPSARRATTEYFKAPATGAFLSTPSARRATPVRRQSHQPGGDFYPRPPRGGRPVAA